MRLASTKREKTVEQEKDEIEAGLMVRRDELEKRCEEKRLARCFHLERRETSKQEELLQAQKAEELRHCQDESAQELCLKSMKIKDEEILQGPKSPIHESMSCTLTETQGKLIGDKVRSDAKQAELMKNWYQDDSIDLLQRRKAEEKKQTYRKELQAQIAENQLIALRKKAEEMAIDREIMERANLAVENTKLDEAKRRSDMDELLRTDRKMFLETKRNLIEKHERILKEEDDKCREAIAEKEEEQKKRKEQTADTLAVKEAMMEKIATKILDDECKEKEREDTLDQLFWQEQRNEWTKEKERGLLKKECTRQELLKDMIEQRKDNAEKEARETAFNTALDQQIAEKTRKIDEKLDQESAERRKRNLQYGEDLRNTILEHRVAHTMEIINRQAEVKQGKEGVNANVNSPKS